MTVQAACFFARLRHYIGIWRIADAYGFSHKIKAQVGDVLADV